MAGRGRRRYGARLIGSTPVLLLALAACSGAGPATPGARPDVVIVTLDTTRADRIGAYGYAGAHTPALDALAARGVRFADALAPLPLTIPAHATLFSGLYPFHHGIRANGDGVLRPEVVTLAERLRAEGWATAASVGAFVTTRQWGFAQGFDAYFDDLAGDRDADPTPGARPDRNYWHQERDGAAVVDDALGWLATQPAEQPVLLWVHLYDAHAPYRAHPGQDAALAERPYDAELAYVDAQVGRLVAAFAGRPALFAVVGDHGESLGEHGEPTHGLYTYDATAHVPWILAGPGIAPRVVEEPRSTVDFLPTVLRALGLDVPDGLDGSPWPAPAAPPYLESWQLTERFELAPHRAIVSDGYKLVDVPRPELYRRADDPGEVHDRAAAEPDVVARLRARLAAMDVPPPRAGEALDAATVSQLAALGYVASGGVVAAGALPDAKDHAAAVAAALRLDHPRGPTPGAGDGEGVRGPDPAALAALDAVLVDLPRSFELRMRRIALLGQLGRADDARAAAEALAADFPTRARSWVTLAALALRQGDAAGAIPLARRAVAAQPDDPAAQEALVEALLAGGLPDEAVEAGEAALARDPRNYGVAALLGQLWLDRGDLARAEPLLHVAVAGPNPRRAARAQLAVLAAAAGARADALALLEAEVRDYPGNLFARRLLARLYGEDRRWADEVVMLAPLEAARPTDPTVPLAIAQCQYNLGALPAARAALDRALALAPEDPDVLLLHANLLAKEGRREEGQAVFQRANALNARRAAGATGAASLAESPASAGPNRGAPTPSPSP